MPQFVSKDGQIFELSELAAKQSITLEELQELDLGIKPVPNAERTEQIAPDLCRAA